jgi:hypothetical protein
MGNLQVRFLEGWAPAMAPGYSTLGIASHLPVIGAQAAINCSEAGFPRSELLRGAVLDRIMSLKIPDDFLCGVLGDRCAISLVHLVYLGFPRRSG